MKDLQGLAYDNHKAIAAALKENPENGKIFGALKENRDTIGLAIAERAEDAAGIKLVDCGDVFHYEEVG